MDAAVIAISPQAEVEEVWPRDGRIRIHGTTVGPHLGEATLVIRARGTQETELRLPAPGHGSRFQADIPLTSLATACTSEEQTWDLYLALPGHGDLLRLGRHLDDITGKKQIFTYPAQSAAGVRIKPYYTVKDNLSIHCRRERP